MCPISTPLAAYQPSGWRKSFCMSITTSAVRRGTRLQVVVVKGCVVTIGFDSFLFQ
jgi:hypothetical protein